MAFTGITVDTVVGDASSGVQAMFPRFVFDDASRPTIAQVREYAKTAIANISRRIQFKGYDPATITAEEDLIFIANWITLTVAAEIHTTLDQFKDNKNSNSRAEQLKMINMEFRETEDPFPGVLRSVTSEAQDSYPTHLYRVSPGQL